MISNKEINKYFNSEVRSSYLFIKNIFLDVCISPNVLKVVYKNVLNTLGSKKDNILYLAILEYIHET